MSEPAPMSPDDRIKEVKTVLVKQIVGTHIGQRKAIITGVFRKLEEAHQRKMQEHLAGSLAVIDRGKEKFNHNACQTLEEEFAQVTRTLEQELTTRLEGFEYRDVLVAKYHDLRTNELHKIKTDFKTGLEQTVQELRQQTRKLYETCFPLRDLRKLMIAKALEAFDEPVPEAALLSVLDEWDKAIEDMRDLLTKHLNDLLIASSANLRDKNETETVR